MDAHAQCGFCFKVMKRSRIALFSIAICENYFKAKVLRGWNCAAEGEYYGHFVDYYGDMIIPEEKQEEFTQRMLTILREGGMMDIGYVSLFDIRLALLRSIKQDENGAWVVSYNYYENDRWPSCVYHAKKCTFSSDKVGVRQFRQVTYTACCTNFIPKPLAWPCSMASSTGRRIQSGG